jgi:hypothetical protein
MRCGIESFPDYRQTTPRNTSTQHEIRELVPFILFRNDSVRGLRSLGNKVSAALFGGG